MIYQSQVTCWIDINNSKFIILTRRDSYSNIQIVSGKTYNWIISNDDAACHIQNRCSNNWFINPILRQIILAINILHNYYVFLIVWTILIWIPFCKIYLSLSCYLRNDVCLWKYIIWWQAISFIKKTQDIWLENKYNIRQGVRLIEYNIVLNILHEIISQKHSFL